MGFNHIPSESHIIGIGTLDELFMVTFTFSESINNLSSHLQD
jgi:hypothetical protein